jgi:hypothetical protein
MSQPIPIQARYADHSLPSALLKRNFLLTLLLIRRRDLEQLIQQCQEAPAQIRRAEEKIAAFEASPPALVPGDVPFRREFMRSCLQMALSDAHSDLALLVQRCQEARDQIKSYEDDLVLLAALIEQRTQEASTT